MKKTPLPNYLFSAFCSLFTLSLPKGLMLIVFLSLYYSPLSFVHADYVLPYPSFMPGNKVYKISRIVDGLKKYWYFGTIAQIKYHTALSDKYLVEAKTLFEYKQYLLGVDALKRSDSEIEQVAGFIENAKKEGKDVVVIVQNIHEQMHTHIQVLEALRGFIPAEFTWTPEKNEPIVLNFTEVIDNSSQIRTANLKKFETVQ